MDAITKDHSPEHNTELILKVRELLQTVSAKRALDFQKVKAHSGNHGNEQADRLANKGATGSQTNMSSRWTLPIGSPSPSDPLLTDFCWRTSYARQLAGHEAHCAIPGAAPPHIPCRRNCGKTCEWRFKQEGKKHFHHAREFRNLHERICRGTDEATRTCPSCLKVFRAGVTDETIWLPRSKCTSQNPPNPEVCTDPIRKMNKCPNCKSKFSSQLEDHLKHCRGDIKRNKTCQSCNLVLQTIDARVKHEEVCRGSDRANKTCTHCSRLFATFGSRITHEKKCGQV